MPRAGIALGSNLGDSLAHLRAALAGLRQIAAPGEPVLIAHIYRTQPHHCPPGSPDFLNSVIEIGFTGGPRLLLETTRTLETLLGRVRNAARNAPRVIDIDLLYLGDTCISNEKLVLPHPRLGGRRFVLQPLADIRPQLVLPGQVLTVAGLLERLSGGAPPLPRLPEGL